MTKKLMLNILFISIVSVNAPASAENWVGLGSDENGRSMYLDKDSIFRQGDLAFINAKLGGNPTTLKFDCIAKNYILPGNIELGMNERVVPIDNSIPKYMVTAFNVTCKKWHNFWK